MSLVYLWCDPKDQTPRYVGKGKSMSRPLTHLKPADSRISRMLNKRLRQGYLPQPMILLDGLSDLAALAVERFWIAVIGREDKKLGPLFNLTDGGDGAAGVVGKTQVAWNKGKKLGPNEKLKGKPLKPETVVKRTAKRLELYDGRYFSGKQETEENHLRRLAGWAKRRNKYGPNGRKEQ